MEGGAECKADGGKPKLWAKEWNRFEQQSPAKNQAPLRLHKKKYQGVCACGKFLVLLIFGVVCLLSAPDETELSYSYTDSTVTFELDVALEHEAFISYSLGGLNMNQKRFITNKEGDMFNNAMNKYECKDAESWSDVAWRRPAWQVSESMNTSGVPFRPCGLVAMSMFDDTYALHSCTDATCDESELVELDDSDVALDADEDVYWRLQAVSDATDYPFYRLESSDDGALLDTWLPAGNFLEHLKVWQRIPPAPCVRNLWAVVRGGLSAGHYRLSITNNDRVWEQQWGLEHKSVIISGCGSLGSAGACVFLGSVAIVFACLEAALAVFFVFAPEPQRRIESSAWG